MRSVSVIGLVGGLLALGSFIYGDIIGEATVASQVVMFVGLVGFFYWLYFNVEGLLRAIGTRQVQQGSLALVITVMGLVVGIGANYIAQRHPKRYDATDVGMFTLAPQTEKVVQGLTEPLQLLAFYSETHEQKARLEDLIEGYRLLNPEMIKVKWYDPLYEPAIAKQYGVRLDGTVVLEMGENSRQLTSVSEEDLTNALIAVTRKTVKKVYFLEGHGEKTPLQEGERGMSQAMGELSKKGFSVETISLFEKGGIPDDARVIVSAGPTQAYLDSEVQALSAWMKKGGRMVLMLDPQVPPELVSFARQWGVDSPEAIIVDEVGQNYIGDATTPVVTPLIANKMTEDLMGALAIFRMARPLRQGTVLPGGNVEMLVGSTANAWGETNLASFTPPAPGTPPEAKVVQFDDGLDVDGPVNVMALARWPVEGETSEAPAEGEEKKTREGMMVVFGDSDFASDLLFAQQINGDLFLNAVSYLAQEEDLLSIRPRSREGKPFNPSESQASFIFYSSVVILPGLSFLLAALMYWRRRGL